MLFNSSFGFFALICSKSALSLLFKKKLIAVFKGPELICILLVSIGLVGLGVFKSRDRAYFTVFRFEQIPFIDWTLESAPLVEILVFSLLSLLDIIVFSYPHPETQSTTETRDTHT